MVAATDGGGGGTAPPTLTAFEVQGAKVSPATLRLVVSGRDGDSLRAQLFFALPSEALAPMTRLSGPGLTGNEVVLPSSPAGTPTDLAWDFAAELGATGFVDDVHLVVTLAGGIVPTTGDLSVGLGNDPPVVLAVEPPAGESSGVVPVFLRVGDSSSDVASLAVEWRRAEGADDWKPATAAGVFPPGIETTPGGAELSFFWDTEADLPGDEDSVLVRVTGDDRTLDPSGSPVGAGQPLESVPFAIDNNAAPIATVEDGILALSPDETRAIAVPFFLRDQESDPVRVLLQWRREEQGSFPDLSSFSRDELLALLDDPARAGERAELQICTERARSFGGRVLPPPRGLDPATHVTLAELASSASSLFAGDPIGAERLAGRTLEILRGSSIPEPVVDDWPSNPLQDPVAALLVAGGPTALVLDSPEPGSWRLREIDLASGRAMDQRSAIRNGNPSALAYEPDERSVLVASDLADTWQVHRVELEDWTESGFVSVLDGDTESGTIRGLVSLGSSAALITVGSSLVRVNFEDLPRTVTLLDGLEMPWGIVLDPQHANRIYLAERDYPRADGGLGRVITVALDTYEIVQVFVHPDTLPGMGLERPTAITLERNGTRLLALTDAVPGDAADELRGLEIGGDDPGVVFEVTGELAASSGIDAPRSLAVGPDGTRILSTGAGLSVAGGVFERRTIETYDPASLTARVSEPFEPAPPSNAPWRMSLVVGEARSDPAGRPGVFVWDSSDVMAAVVHLRIVPVDTDVGLDDEGQAPKGIRGFDEPAYIGTEEGWNHMAAADLDDDGRLDLLSAGAPAGSQGFLTSLLGYFGGPRGSFSSNPDMSLEDPLLYGAQGIVAADLDGDGRIDAATGVATLPPEQGGVLVFFQPPGGFPSRTATSNLVLGRTSTDVDLVYALKTADLDRDGDLDLVALDSTYFEGVVPGLPDGSIDSLALFLQPSSGFMDDVEPDLRLDPLLGSKTGIALDVDIVDVNEDGQIDLVVQSTHDESPPFRVFTAILVQQASSASTPGFAAPQVIFEAASFTGDGVEAVDLDRDGRVDLTSFIGVDSFVHFQRPGFEFPAEPDLVLNSSDSGIESLTRPFGADINADGRLDMVFNSFASDQVGAFLQGPDGRFSNGRDVMLPQRTEGPVDREVGDWNADGRPDFATTLTSSGGPHVAVHLQEAPGRFPSTPDLELGTSALNDRPQWIAAADLNGDGKQDLASANAESNALTLFVQGVPGAFDATPSIVLADARFDEPFALVLADIDGDGRIDAASANASSDNLAVFFQGSSGQFQGPPVELGSSSQMDRPQSIVAADLDADGRLDLASANAASNDLSLFFQPIPREFSAVEALGGPGITAEPHGLAAADWNADGILDLASANLDRVSLFLGSGGQFSAPIVLEHPGIVRRPEFLLGADLNADGRLDIATANLDGDAVSIFHQPKTGFISAQAADVVLANLDAPRCLVAADLNADGLLDLATANELDQNLAIFRRGPTGGFSPAPEFLGGPGSTQLPHFLLAADLNADDELDLATALHRPESPGSSVTPFDVIALFFGGE